MEKFDAKQFINIQLTNKIIATSNGLAVLESYEEIQNVVKLTLIICEKAIMIGAGKCRENVHET
jgi:hypothetical protein